MRISLNWLKNFVDLSESVEELRSILDDLGLVVEAVDTVGEGLDDVVVARVDEIRSIEGADRIRLVVVDCGAAPLEIVCGAMNFSVGDHVPLAPVGSVLPGNFVIAQRKMRGVTSNGMLCSARELGLSDDHEGLMILDPEHAPRVGTPLLEALNISRDTIFDITIEGNRPDAWSVLGVARDLATRLGRPLRHPELATPNSDEVSSSFASAGIDDPDLCGRLTVSVLRGVKVRSSPLWVAQRLQSAGMRPISNVVDASNLVMLELGQPTHPYDAAHVGERTLRARRARVGEVLVTLDGVSRELAKAGRGLGDTGEDCVIVDGQDRVLGLAGIMGGASSEIGPETTDVLLEAAFFDPMTIARSTKRHGLRSEASNRFERGVDPQLALRAAARFVAVLRESCPDLQWLADPLDVRGVLPSVPTIELRAGDVARGLGVELDESEIRRHLEGLGFSVSSDAGNILVTPPTSRLDVRSGAAGRADVLEEIARLHSYRLLPRRMPVWPQPGRLSERQKLRRRLRDVVVDLGVFEAWTPTLGSDDDFDRVHPGVARVRVTNPLAANESVLRATMITGLLNAWVRNLERGCGDVMLGEIGMVFHHPEGNPAAHLTRGGSGGAIELALPSENERLTVLLGRDGDDALSSVGLWAAISERLNLADVVVRSCEAPAGMHPSRAGALFDRRSGAAVGFVGEIDPQLIEGVAPTAIGQRLGVVDIDIDVLADTARTARRSSEAKVPSRYPSAVLDLALITPVSVHAADLRFALEMVSPLIESVTLFDVYRGVNLPEGTRSLAYNVRLSSPERTLNDDEIVAVRAQLIESAQAHGAQLR